MTIADESHTIAAPLIERMTQDPSCIFSAYKVNHPADTFVSLKIQGNETRNAKDILENSLRSIISDLDDILIQVKKSE